MLSNFQIALKQRGFSLFPCRLAPEPPRLYQQLHTGICYPNMAGSMYNFFCILICICMFMGGFLSTFKFCTINFFFNNRFLVSVEKIETSGRTGIICPICPNQHQPASHLYFL